MSDNALNILLVPGSLSPESSSTQVLAWIQELLENDGSNVDFLNYHQTPLELFNPEVTYASSEYAHLRKRVVESDVLVFATPDYHGCVSGTCKNFLDHFWKEYAGKLFVSVIASYEKGLTAADQIRTVARQCYAWALPYGVSYIDKKDFAGGKPVSDDFKERLEMLVRDIQVYGSLLALQRRKDLEGNEPGFMAHYR